MNKMSNSCRSEIITKCDFDGYEKVLSNNNSLAVTHLTRLASVTWKLEGPSLNWPDNRSYE